MFSKSDMAARTHIAFLDFVARIGRPFSALGHRITVARLHLLLLSPKAPFRAPSAIVGAAANIENAFC